MLVVLAVVLMLVTVAVFGGGRVYFSSVLRVRVMKGMEDNK